MCFASSVAIDVVIGGEGTSLVLEDGLKAVGIATFAVFSMRCSFAAMTYVIPTTPPQADWRVIPHEAALTAAQSHPASHDTAYASTCAQCDSEMAAANLQPALEVATLAAALGGDAGEDSWDSEVPAHQG